MNVIWLTRLSRWAWYLRLGPFRQWRECRRTRRELLALPGVDHLVVNVMDMRFGKYGWRVNDGLLEAHVQTHGAGTPWWGAIGPLRSINTRKWLTSVWMEYKGVSHVKPLEFYTPQDTKPIDDVKD